MQTQGDATIRGRVDRLHTFDPIAKEYQWHPGDRSASRSVDADYDGECFVPTPFHFEDRARDRKVLAKLAGRDADPDVLDASIDLAPSPSRRTASSRIAVRIVTNRGQTPFSAIDC